MVNRLNIKKGALPVYEDTNQNKEEQIWNIAIGQNPYNPLVNIQKKMTSK